MKDSYIRKEDTEKLAKVTSLPLFASYHQAHLDGKSLKEWLYSQPLELLIEYAEATLFSEDENDVKSQDMMATAMLLKSAVTNNKPLAEEEVVAEVRFLQVLLTAVSVNKEVQGKWKDDIEVININNCTWKKYDTISMQADPRVKLKEKNSSLN